MSPMNEEDMTILDNLEDGGSPNARLMKAIAPPNATQSEHKWNQVSQSLLSYPIFSILEDVGGGYSLSYQFDN